MTREEKENLLREAVDILIKLDNHLMTSRDNAEFSDWVEDLFVLEEQEPKTDRYEYHTDHTDCLWYGCEGGCPVTCSQYRDGWNDAMDYIFMNGKGYQPYRRDY